jgi:polyhydroxybutyrate depolymerase
MTRSGTILRLRAARPAAVMSAMIVLLAGCFSTTDTAGTGNSPGPVPSATPAATLAATAVPTDHLAPTVVSDVLEFGGQERSYRMAVPAVVPADSSIPLMLVLHGLTMSPINMEGVTGFDELATDPGVLVVYPAGYQHSWNAGGCCEPATTDGVDDVGFIAALIDKLEIEYPIDPNRVFVVGGSNGGEMAYRVACELSDRIAAVANLIGTLLTACAPAHGVSVLDIHGTADTDIPYSGGIGCQHVACPSVPDTMQRWRELDGCTGEPSITEDAHTVATTFAACRDGTEVTFIKAIGKGHAWYDHNPDDRAVTWAFFASHPRSK